ncbi:MAG: molybdopterin biosynthesis protein [Pirellulales bacterium]
MSGQDQFLQVVDRDEAERRFHAVLDLAPLPAETVPLYDALGRIVAADVVAEVDVPSFDRSNYDGYAVRAEDTFGASEEQPRRLRLLDEQVITGSAPAASVEPGTAMGIATGGMLPRGADAVAMVEHTVEEGVELAVYKAVSAGFGVSFAGTDIARGETILWGGQLLTSRETGVLAAVGVARVSVIGRPHVAIMSTGDELVAPGNLMQPGRVYDSNAQILADAVRELGAVPLPMGIVSDDRALLTARLDEAIASSDLVLLSGGTSKGQGDLSYRVVAERTSPGIVAHGVALKPGKPICLASHGGKAVVILPGFPTSAIFTFHEFVAPVIRTLGGRSSQRAATRDARLAVKVHSEIGRTEFLLVGLVSADDELIAYPMGKGSGSVTTFSRADGFVTIGRHTEIVDAGSTVAVQLIAPELAVADLVVIGSHCVGLDYLLGRLQKQGWKSKFLAVGSTAGLDAARRGECDIAGIHLLDPATGQYNRPLLTDELELLSGYGRKQGIVCRAGDARFAGKSVHEAIAAALADPECTMINRNRGSGTRILIDRALAGAQPPGYAVQAKNHNAVAAAVLQGRADWGIAIETVARDERLAFLPLEDELYDFVVPKTRRDRPAVEAFARLLQEAEARRHLASLGFSVARAGGR